MRQTPPKDIDGSLMNPVDTIPEDKANPSLTGYRRPKEARRVVILADHIAKRVITAGGVMVIGAILGILGYLVIQVLPLFREGTAAIAGKSTRPALWAKSAAAILDERHALAVEIGPGGEAMAYHPGTGEIVSQGSIAPPGAQVTSIGYDQSTGAIAVGLADGGVIQSAVDFRMETLEAGFDVSGLKPAGAGEWIGGGAVYSQTAQDQIRKVAVNIPAPITVKPAGGPAVVALAMASLREEGSRSDAVAALDGGGNLSLYLSRVKKNIMTGQVKTSVRLFHLPRPPETPSNPRLFITDNGAQVLLAGENGTLFRYNLADPEAAFLAETALLTPPGVKATAIAFLAGRQSLVVGASDGGVAIHYILPRPGAGPADGLKVVLARRLEPHMGAVIIVATAAAGKSFLTADSAGVWLRNGTSGRTLLRMDKSAAGPGAIRALAPAPGLGGALLAMDSGAVLRWNIHAPHPEASASAFFGGIWYEGYPGPSFTWQSSAATEDFEPKLSLVPLIFGTLKATFYSMLFAAPVALLAAVFTSEFLDKRLRAPMKTAMEMMASLPSVVLGFVAALILAPVVERYICQVMLAGLSIPLALVLGALLWQLLPPPLADRLSGGAKIFAMAAALLAGLGAAAILGGPFERWFFHEDFKRWLVDRNQGAAPFLIMLFLPLATAAVAMFRSRSGKTQAAALWPRGAKAGLAGLGGASVTMAAGAFLALAGAAAVQWLGFDPRDALLGQYVQRNTLIVGFAMGFAVIPIIYTLAEDALSAVPDHLRAASLGCGATVWQTAIWVVIPTAISGIFSALMIGMGRAVGETMIVVMAAGNTPVMEINVFSGLRALSANIAVETPEAVVGGTLYRTLFLSALALFLMTFIINTAAEMVRLSFRKRFSRL